MSFDFALRRGTTRAIKTIGRTAKFLFVGAVKLILRNRKKAQETPFDAWNRSPHKETVKVVFDVDGQELETIATFQMDTKAPCDILREYIRRNAYQQLNEKCGDSFSIVILRNAKLDILPRKKESKTYTKDFTQFVMDHITMEAAQTVTIMQERGKNRVIIPPPELATALGDDGSQQS